MHGLPRHWNSVHSGWKTASAIVLAVALLNVAALPAWARKATHNELLAFSREAANDSKLGSVEIGGGYVEGYWAIASWRSVDRKRRGQAVFFHMCDHWNLAETRVDVFTKSNLSRLHRAQPLTPQIAARLETDSLRLQRIHTAYLPPSHRTRTC
jgi:hypothetical protein